MVGFRKLAVAQTKLYLRDPMSAFFTLAFGPGLLILLGLIFGNAPSPETGGLGYLSASVPAYIGVIVAIVGLTAVPIGSSMRREQGILRRLSMTPLRPLTYFLTDMLAPFVVTLLGILLLILVGRILFGIRFEGNALSLVAAVALGSAAFFSLGYALLGLIPNTRALMLIGNVVLYVLMILSGAIVPLQVMPEAVRRLSGYLPLTHLVTLLRGMWTGQPWSDFAAEAIVLASMAVLCTLIVSRTFRWE